MIYLDNAATSFPKPPEVLRRVKEVLEKHGGNPGRGGHYLARKADEEVYNCRKEVKEFFNAGKEDNVVFTQNATTALNICINGLVEKGNRVITTDYEHNSVRRPLMHIPNAEIYKVPISLEDQDETLWRFENSINRRIHYFVVSHASNVFGKSIPLKGICQLAHRIGAEVIVDASQSAGILDIDMQRDEIDYLCAPGHKGLYGPQGSGFFIINGKRIPKPYIYGGTGSASFASEQPNFLPDMHESGTLSTPAISGLAAGVRFLKRIGRDSAHRREFTLISRCYEHLSGMKNILLYAPKPTLEDAPLLSFNIRGKPSFETAKLLDEYGFCVRAGYHCAPDAHRKLLTTEHGTVRVSVGVFNTPSEIDRFAEILQKISK